MKSPYRMIRFRLLANDTPQFSSRKTIGGPFRKLCISPPYPACVHRSKKVSKPRLPSAARNLHGKLATCFYQAGAKRCKKDRGLRVKTAGRTTPGNYQRKSLQNSPALRKTCRRSVRCLFPQDQYSAPAGLSGFGRC